MNEWIRWCINSRNIFITCENILRNKYICLKVIVLKSLYSGYREFYRLVRWMTSNTVYTVKASSIELICILWYLNMFNSCFKFIRGSVINVMVCGLWHYVSLFKGNCLNTFFWRYSEFFYVSSVDGSSINTLLEVTELIIWFFFCYLLLRLVFS